ncbi:unnamed protein product, partial [Meganyctiphanes norvegica]
MADEGQERIKKSLESEFSSDLSSIKKSPISTDSLHTKQSSNTSTFHPEISEANTKGVDKKVIVPSSLFSITTEYVSITPIVSTVNSKGKTFDNVTWTGVNPITVAPLPTTSSNNTSSIPPSSTSIHMSNKLKDASTNIYSSSFGSISPLRSDRPYKIGSPPLYRLSFDSPSTPKVLLKSGEFSPSLILTPPTVCQASPRTSTGESSVFIYPEQGTPCDANSSTGHSILSKQGETTTDQKFPKQKIDRPINTLTKYRIKDIRSFKTFLPIYELPSQDVDSILAIYDPPPLSPDAVSPVTPVRSRAYTSPSNFAAFKKGRSNKDIKFDKPTSSKVDGNPQDVPKTLKDSISSTITLSTEKGRSNKNNKFDKPTSSKVDGNLQDVPKTLKDSISSTITLSTEPNDRLKLSKIESLKLCKSEAIIDDTFTSSSSISPITSSTNQVIKRNEPPFSMYLSSIIESENSIIIDTLSQNTHSKNKSVGQSSSTITPTSSFPPSNISSPMSNFDSQPHTTSSSPTFPLDALPPSNLDSLPPTNPPSPTFSLDVLPPTNLDSLPPTNPPSPEFNVDAFTPLNYITSKENEKHQFASTSPISIQSNSSLSMTPPLTPLLIVSTPCNIPEIYLHENTPSPSPSTRHISRSEIRIPASDDNDSTSVDTVIQQVGNDKTKEADHVDTDEEAVTLSIDGDSDIHGKPRHFDTIRGLAYRMTHRQSLQLPTSHPLLNQSRKLSTLSITSLSPGSVGGARRASLTSLLSVTPSLARAARRFSFGLGSDSRCETVPSVSFKSLDSYISTDNLLGLRSYLESERDLQVDDRDENGTTALMLAAQQGKTHFCNELIHHGADVNAQDNDQWTALICSSKEGHYDVVALLLDNSAEISHKDVGGWTSIMWASYKGHADVAKLLLERGADPNTQGPHHMTSLVWAAGRGHTEIAKALIDHKAKVNIGDKFGTTALIWACRKGYYDIAEALLRNGANVDASGMYCWTPLLVATHGNFIDLVNLLIDFKPNLNALDKDGRTALTIACKEGYTDIANTLLSAGVYVNMQDTSGDTNLIHAARSGHQLVVEALLMRHADVDMVGKERKTPLYWTVEKGHNSVAKILVNYNPNLEIATKDGDTALLRAVRSKNAELVQLLVNKKARVSVTDKKGETALHIAMRCRSKKIVEVLLRNPKNSQLLYRPNRAGETPYNMDLSNQKTIMGQIFGARRLNTNEDNENMLGYDLYSSSLADILSEPSLSMPISVGLFAKWGSGKSFLIRKLREEMSSFTKVWVEPLFQFSPLVFILILHLALLSGLLAAVPSFSWQVGLVTGAGVFLAIVLVLTTIWHGSRKYDWPFWFRWSILLEEYIASIKVVLQVIFCSPPGPQWKEWKEGSQAKPLKFIFGEGAKPSSSTAGENSVVQMLGSLFDKIEDEYGLFATRLYRAFRPKPKGLSSPWRYRRLCCMPYIVIFFITLICTLTALTLTGLFGIHPESYLIEETLEREARSSFDDDDDDDDDDNSQETSMETTELLYNFHDLRPYHGALMNPLLITLGILVAVVVIANLHTIARMFGSLIFSHRRHLLRSVAKLDTLKAEGYLRTLKAEVNLMVDMVQCLDAFNWQQTRLVVIVDGLDSCEQEKVLSVLDTVHGLFSESNAPFIILLAIDPHIITKAIELHVHRVFNDSSISGHDYLRNIVHLPFYLQNSGLRKVKQAQMAAERKHSHKSQASWMEMETESLSLAATTSAIGGLNHIPVGSKLSNESGVNQYLTRNNSRRSRRVLKATESVGSSIVSNANPVGGAQDLTK